MSEQKKKKKKWNLFDSYQLSEIMQEKREKDTRERIQV